MNENISAVVVEDEKPLPRIPKSVPATTVVKAKTRKGETRYHTRAYAVPDDIAEPLKAMADLNCYMCHGSGVKDFRANGAKARVCRCVLDKQDSLKPVEG